MCPLRSKVKNILRLFGKSVLLLLIFLLVLKEEALFFTSLFICFFFLPFFKFNLTHYLFLLVSFAQWKFLFRLDLSKQFRTYFFLVLN